MAIVDTEAAFEWAAPFDRAATGVEHTRRIDGRQAVFEHHGLHPVYALGTPIATSPTALTAPQPIRQAEQALIGAHLIPEVPRH